MTNGRKCAFVTGGTGFIGSNLVRALVTQDWDVHVVVRANSPKPRMIEPNAKITIHEHDGTTADLVRAVASARPDIAFHLASLFLAEHHESDIEKLIAANVLFGTQVVEALAVNGVRNLVNTGTSWQHYHSANYRPVCLYAATKQAFEAILDYYIDAKDMRVITLKLFDTFGPGDPRPKLFSFLAGAARSDSPIDFSAGEQLIDLVFIDDVIRAFLCASERLLSAQYSRKEEFAVSSGKPIPLRELISTYVRVTGEKLNIRWAARPYREREVMQTWDTGVPIPGWAPRVTLEDGIRRLVIAQKDR